MMPEANMANKKAEETSAGERAEQGDSAELHASIPPEKIAMRAYEKWCQRGRPHGTEKQSWLEAEAELRAESTRSNRADISEQPIPVAEAVVVIGSPKPLIKKLSDKDESVREEAIAKLTFFGAEVLLAIIHALNDDSPKVRAMAREHFFAVHWDFPFSPRLRKYLESDEHEDRLQGIQEIVRTLPAVREAIVERRPGWERLACWMSSTAEDPMEPRQGQPSPRLVTHISPGAYLRSVWAVVWSALRYPRSTTLIDLSSGQAVHIKTHRAKTEAPSP